MNPCSGGLGIICTFLLPPMGKSENNRLLPSISHHAVSIHLGCAPTFYTSFAILSCSSDSYRLTSLAPLLFQPVWLPLKLNLIGVMYLCCVVRCRFCANGAAGHIWTNRNLEKMRWGVARWTICSAPIYALCVLLYKLVHSMCDCFEIWVWMMKKLRSNLPCQSEPDIESIWLMTRGQTELWD